MPQNIFDEVLDERARPVAQQQQQTNEFDAVLDEREDEQRRRMLAAQAQAAGSSPDARADALKLSQKSGLPADVVERNYDDVKKRWGGLPLKDIQLQTPALAEWSTNPDHAAISADDTENLGAIEWLLKAPSRAFAQQLNSIRYSELRFKELMGSTLTQDERDHMGSYKFHSGRGGDLGVGDSWFKKAVTGAGRLLAQSVDPAKYGVVGGLETGVIGAGAGSVIPGVGTVGGAVTGFGYGARAGVAYGVFKSTAMQEAADTYDEMLAMHDEAGVPIDPGVARVAALSVGAINGALELTGLEKVLEKFPALRSLKTGARKEAVKFALQNPTVRAALARVAKDYAATLGTEVATEVAQRGVTILGQEAEKLAEGGKMPARSKGDVWDDLVDTAAGAIPEFALGLAPGPMQQFARDVHEAKKAEQSVHFFTALGEGVQQSKTAQRMPEAFEALVKDATKDGPIKDVYVDTGEWRTYWQSQGQDPVEAATAITGRANALNDAETSGKLRIPMERYASQLAGTEHNAALINELRLGRPEAMNGRELEDFKGNIEAEKQKVADAAAAAAQANEDRAIQAQAEEQLVGANVPRETARTAVQALQGVASMARRAGFDPTETWNDLGFQVVRRPAAEVVGESGFAQVNDPDVGTAEEIPGLADLERSLGGASLAPIDDDGVRLNASGDSAASAEALSRNDGMRSRGEQFVVYDRAGRRRTILGPDAVDYVARQGETYGVEGPAGFRLLEDRGGRVPAPGTVEGSPLGNALRATLTQRQALPGVAAGLRVQGQSGPANAKGESAHFVGYQPAYKDIMPTHALYNVVGGEMDGSTVDEAKLREMGIPVPPTPPLLELYQRATAAQPALQAWFGNSVVVDEDGAPMVVFHGTTRVFSAFDRERANIESDFGQGFYFSNNPRDVGANYAGKGPDLKNKIERDAERIEQELVDLADNFETMTDAEREQLRVEAQKQAEQLHAQHGGMTIPVFLKIENPVVLGGESETMLTYELESDEETGDFTGNESGTLVDFVKALRDEAGRWDGGGDIDAIIAPVMEHALDDGGITAAKAIEILRKQEELNYFTDEKGDLAGNEMIRAALQRAGFDGVIDRTVDVKFGSQRRIGKSMAGMDEDTVHYIVFEPTQIKSAIGNKGTFDPLSADILFQSATDALEPMETARSIFYSRITRTVEEAKQNKATGREWKGMIRNSKLGVNIDEFAITNVEDLEDGTSYTKDEVLAYLKLNRPKLDVVTLEGDGPSDEEVEERAQSIRDDMEREYLDNFDWEELTGSPTTIEEEIERETGEVDEDGDDIMETVTVYYPAVDGGLVKRWRSYGSIERRRGVEQVPDSDSYEDEDEAEKAAKRYVSDLEDEDWIRERGYESASEAVDYSEAEEQARRELESEGGTGGGRYGEYILDPAPEEDSYREVFITAPDSGKWQDGHDLYKDVKNPIVRIRLDVRRVEVPAPVVEEVQDEIDAVRAMREAQVAIEPLRNKQHNGTRFEGIPALTDAEVEEIDRLQEIIDRGHKALDANARRVSRARLDAPQGERMLFIEEVQPPHDDQQEKMPAAFVKNWREIAWKWILRHAIDEGYERIGWTTGRQQVERYASIERYVQRISWNDTPSTGEAAPEGEPQQQTLIAAQGRLVHLRMRNDSDIFLTVGSDGAVINAHGQQSNEFIGQPLGAIIGEELGEKIMGAESKGTLSGKGLAIGGKGLARLYDKDFPAIISKIPAVKKAGVKIEHVPMLSKADLVVEQIPEDERGKDGAAYLVRRGTETLKTFATQDAAWQWKNDQDTTARPQPSLKITDELRELALKGQPLFQGDFGYRPTTAAERETLQAALTASVMSVMEKLPTAGHTVDAYITTAGEIHVGALSVKASERGQGIGTAIMRAVIDFADDHNMQVSLDQAPSQGKKLALRRFYSRLGFVKNGTARFYDASASGAWVRPAKNDMRTRRRLQESATTVKGAIQFARADAQGMLRKAVTVSLFEKADLSTFLHETGHLYLELFGDLVERIHGLDPTTLTDQQQKFLADYDAILRHLGATHRDTITREQHELFARSFEAYLFEGKAPSPELRTAFARMRAWMVSVYKSLKALNAPLSDEIRGVFDRMLASDDAIAEAEAQGRLQPMFLTADQAKMTPERFALYRDAVEAASTSARERLDRELLAEVSREQTAQWKERKAEIKKDVTTAAHQMPVYGAIAAIQRGTHPDGTSLVEGAKPVPMKLSKQMIIERFGRERLRTLPRTLVTATEGTDPDVIADLFGYKSADELLTAISSAEQMQRYITTETDRRMLQEHGSMLLDGSIVEEAQAAVADEQREVILREELRALAALRRDTAGVERVVATEHARERAYERRWFEAEAKLKTALAKRESDEVIDKLRKDVSAAKAKARSGPATIRGAVPGTDAIRDMARDLIARTKVMELLPEPYFAAARQASRLAVEAAARQDFDTAIEAKQRELINLGLAREIQRAKADVTKRVQQVRDIAKPGSMAKLLIAGETYHDQVAGVLARYEFANVSQKALERRAALWKWVQGQESQGFDIDLPDELLDETKAVNYKQLTVEELVGVTDGIKSIVHLARFKNRLSKQQKTRSLKRLATTLGQGIRAHKPTIKDSDRDRRTGGERKRLVMGVLAAHRKLASLLREMDGWIDGGPMVTAIMVPLNKAGAREAEMNADATQRLNDLVEAAYPKGEKRKLYEKAFVPGVNRSLSKMERLMIALNWGNDGNRDRVRNSEGWTDTQVQQVLDSLDERDAILVQGILDFVGSYWTEIAAKSERINGVRPVKVQAVKFRIGTMELAGGYFPIKYDDRRSAQAMASLDLEAANLAKLSAVAQATTKRGHEKARAETNDQPLRYDFGVITEHVMQVIHDLSHHETLIDVGRILGHKEVAQAIVEHYGDITYKTIKNTLRDVALGDVPAQNGFERALNHTRTGSTIVGLAWNLATVLVQPLGLTVSTKRLGVKAMARGMARFLGTPQRMSATVDWIYEQSPMMKQRGSTMQRELNEIRNTVGVYSGKLSGWVDDALSTTTLDLVSRQGIADSYFYLIGKSQQFVDVPTFLGAYDKAIRDGREHEDAVAIAEQAVLDTQGGGQIKDLSAVQRGGPALKLWTNFYSAFNALYNEAVESGKKTSLDPASVGRLAVDYMLLFVVPATAGYFVRAALKGGPDDDDKKNPLAAFVRENLSYLMGTMVGLRELSGAVSGYYGYEGPAGARIFSSASKLVQQAKQEKLDEGLLRALNDTAGTLFHYPAGQVWRTTKGIAALIEGKTENPAALITGPTK